MAVVRRMGPEAAPGVFHAPGNTDVIPSGTPPPPPPPPPSGLLKFGTTMFGQSYSRYKEPTLAATGGTRYDAVENDTQATVGGTLHKGSGVTRVYGGTGPGVWSDAHPAYMRTDHPVIYSWKVARGQTQAAFKTDVRAFLDSKNATTTAFAWLLIWHEPDNDWSTDGTLFAEWCNWNTWMRQVINEAAYSSRTDFRFGFITTGGPWGQNQNPDTTTGVKGWRTIYNGCAAGTWDFLGMDRYNPGWNGPVRYMVYDNWAFRAQQMHAETGLPMVIGECGTPRAQTTNGQTLAQQDVERAAYWRSMCDGMLTDGFYDAAAWWRVPAVKNNPAFVSKIANPFSTVMITPTGYNATLTAAGETPPPGGTDAQAVVDVHSEYCVKSMLAAVPPISFQP